MGGIGPAAEHHFAKGAAFLEARQWRDAIAEFQNVLTVRPTSSGAMCNIASALCMLGRWNDAIEYASRALAIQPVYAEALTILGLALYAVGRIDDSITASQNALVQDRNVPEAWTNLGLALLEVGRVDEALAAYEEGLRLRPDWPEGLRNFGNALMRAGRFDDAAAAFERAIALRPNFAMGIANLANALFRMGRIDDSLKAFRRAISISDHPDIRRSMLQTMYFSPDCTPAQILAEHRRWAEVHARGLRPSAVHTNSHDPDRRLRIGYVSPVFRNHVVGRFLVPVLSHHDHVRFEIYCYSDVSYPDSFTGQLRSFADTWRNTFGSTDEFLTNLIREDRIDILVDLNLHLEKSRLLVFARKPAPVQVTYLAYAGTSGLEAMDYRLTDPYLDPPDTVADYVEESVRLPNSYWCYQAPSEAPDVGRLPAIDAGHVTFGCLNEFGKVSRASLELWSEIMRRLPLTRFMLHCPEGSPRAMVREVFARRGIGPQRVSFVGLAPLPQYFHRYCSIDIALDPFPYGGGTTTCDALWMGVPVVTLRGRTAVGRSGVSILSNIGLPELIAPTSERYIDIAAGLAGDVPRLRELRNSLRSRMLGSPLMDAVGFTHEVEAAYRGMWQRWCSSQQTR